MKKHFKSEDEMMQWVLTQGSGKCWHQLILHDDACTPSICVCSPEFIVEPLTEDSLTEGMKAQAKWVKESTS